MSATNAVSSSASVYNTPAFWERLWRTAGIQSLGCFVLAYFIYGNQPQVGAPADALAAFYTGGRIHTLIAGLGWFGCAQPHVVRRCSLDLWMEPQIRLSIP